MLLLPSVKRKLEALANRVEHFAGETGAPIEIVGGNIFPTRINFATSKPCNTEIASVSLDLSRALEVPYITPRGELSVEVPNVIFGGIELESYFKWLPAKLDLMTCALGVCGGRHPLFVRLSRGGINNIALVGEGTGDLYRAMLQTLHRDHVQMLADSDVGFDVFAPANDDSLGRLKSVIVPEGESLVVALSAFSKYAGRTRLRKLMTDKSNGIYFIARMKHRPIPGTFDVVVFGKTDTSLPGYNTQALGGSEFVAEHKNELTYFKGVM